MVVNIFCSTRLLLSDCNHSPCRTLGSVGFDQGVIAKKQKHLLFALLTATLAIGNLLAAHPLAGVPSTHAFVFFVRDEIESSF